jgi:hypothetical protein
MENYQGRALKPAGSREIQVSLRNGHLSWMVAAAKYAGVAI